jgi:hypothetical protein
LFFQVNPVVAVLLIILLISSCHVCYYYLCYHTEQILCTTVLTMVFKKIKNLEGFCFVIGNKWHFDYATYFNCAHYWRPYIIVTVTCRIAIKAWFLYLNLCLSVTLHRFSCSFTSISFLTIWNVGTTLYKLGVLTPWHVCA